VSNVKLLPDEEVGGVKARVVAYDLTWKAFGTPDTVKMRVWIDPKTKLPLRRTMTVKLPAVGQPGAGVKDAVYTAVHKKFEINPKLDDKLFELPE
jgi:outer membrane lipoprotein-sorting protein